MENLSIGGQPGAYSKKEVTAVARIRASYHMPPVGVREESLKSEELYSIRRLKREEGKGGIQLDQCCLPIAIGLFVEQLHIQTLIVARWETRKKG